MSCNEWKETILGDVISLKRGYDLPQNKRVDGKYPIIASNGVTGYHNEMKVKGPGVTTGRSGTLGKTFYIDSDFWPLNTSLYVNDFKGNNPKFICYFLRVLELNRFNAGSGVPTLNRNHINSIQVKIPNLENQEKIANILSSLDDKIQLNNEMNKTLEEMAQSIFKRWFVDFEFPNEDGQPYKSSGGEMVDSEFGMIPNGWEVKCIYDLAEYINGTSFKAKDYSEKGLPIIKIAELKNGVTDGTKFFSGEKDKKFYLKNGDILFSWSGNPDTSIDTFIWDKGDAILNQHIFKVIPKFDKGYAFTYLMLKYLKSTFTHIARNKQTTGLGHVTVKDLKELKIALCFSKIKEFNEVAQPIVDLIFENNMNIEQLNKIRDSLLPKLMSGEIRVK